MNKINENIKAYFLDLDGTLLDEKTSKGNYGVSGENKEAIKQAQKNKKIIIISTGRMGPYVENLIKELDIPYAVTANGAIVIDQKGKVLKSDPLTKNQFLLLLDIIKDNKLCMKLDGGLEAYGSLTWITKKMSKKFGLVPHDNYNCEMHKIHHKVIVWGKSKGALLKLKDKIESKVKDLSVVTSSNGWILEITNKDSTKGLGNIFVATKLLKLDKKEIIHVGDTMNDSTAAKHMKLIALKNADKKLKALASHFGPDWRNGGVAKVLDGEYWKKQK